MCTFEINVLANIKTPSLVNIKLVGRQIKYPIILIPVKGHVERSGYFLLRVLILLVTNEIKAKYMLFGAKRRQVTILWWENDREYDYKYLEHIISEARYIGGYIFPIIILTKLEVLYKPWSVNNTNRGICHLE